MNSKTTWRILRILLPRRRTVNMGWSACLGLAVLGSLVWAPRTVAADPPGTSLPWADYAERLEQPPAELDAPLPTSAAGSFIFGGLESVQVNVDGNGLNIVGDAANEPSLAVNPTDPQTLVIGWRQFNSMTSNFRQAGIGRSADGGQTWQADVLEPGVFRSDPVLDFDHQGIFYYYSLTSDLTCDTFRSVTGGDLWGPAVGSFGGDKAWIAVDRTGGLGQGFFYSAWTPGLGCCEDDRFNRSTDGAQSFGSPIPVIDQPIWGVPSVAPNGDVYLIGSRVADGIVVVARSTGANDVGQPLAFDFAVQMDLGGRQTLMDGPNPGGLLGQLWIDSQHGSGPRQGHLYALGSLDPPGADPLDVFFSRSTDGGFVWSPPQRLNTDSVGAWQWFGTLGVAPEGRIDAVWADTRFADGDFTSVLLYRFSTDGGVNWSSEIQLTPGFDPHLGWPQQNKLGDYYDIVSFDDAVHLAYAATFNGEQDVYYLRIPADGSVFQDGFESGDVSRWSASEP